MIEKNVYLFKQMTLRKCGDEDPALLKAMPFMSQTLDLVTKVFKVSSKEIICQTRSDMRTALARQTAMYLVHICFGLNLTQTGKLFLRDRTTVAYACKVIEDKRDRNDFDQKITIIEETLRQLYAIDKRAA